MGQGASTNHDLAFQIAKEKKEEVEEVNTHQMRKSLRTKLGRD